MENVRIQYGGLKRVLFPGSIIHSHRGLVWCTDITVMTVYVGLWIEKKGACLQHLMCFILQISCKLENQIDKNQHGSHGPGKLLGFLGAVLEFYEKVLEYLRLQQNKFILTSKD